MGLIEDIQAEIETRSLLTGGWAGGNGSQASVETTCYGLLALHDRDSSARDNAIEFLSRVRNQDGSWPAFDGDDREGCWTTTLALITLRFINARFTNFEKSLAWLLKNKGREGHWLWKWKFKTVDRAVQLNPDKFGWAWFPGSVSWIIPTVFSLIALRQSAACCHTEEVTDRIRIGMDMLRDRACPQGGWNAGNGIVFGAALKPHIDATAIALLAVSDSSNDPTAIRGLGWLRDASRDCSSVFSLSWTALALLMHRDATLNSCVANLNKAFSGQSSISNIEALSLAVIAMNAVQDNRNPFRVVI